MRRQHRNILRYVPMSMRHSQSGFTLIEAMVAIALAAIAGSVLLVGTTTSIQNTDEAMRRTIANGMAQQLMDEIVGGRYMEYGGTAYAATLGPGSAELAVGNRTLYDDIDDYNGYRCQPPKDLYGVALGGDDGQGGTRNANYQANSLMLRNFRQEVDVYYVAASALNTKLAVGSTSDYRVVEVRIIYDDSKKAPFELVKMRRVIPYVAPLDVE